MRTHTRLRATSPGRHRVSPDSTHIPHTPHRDVGTEVIQTAVLQVLRFPLGDAANLARSHAADVVSLVDVPEVFSGSLRGGSFTAPDPGSPHPDVDAITISPITAATNMRDK